MQRMRQLKHGYLERNIYVNISRAGIVTNQTLDLRKKVVTYNWN